MEEMDTLLFLAGATLGEQSAGFGIDNKYIAIMVAYLTVFLILFLQNLSCICFLIFKAPWFHFVILLNLIYRLFSTFSPAEDTESRFRLLVRLRMATGKHRAHRLSCVGLLCLHNSPNSLHSLEAICCISQDRALSKQMNMVSLEDLPYVRSASDIMS